MNKTDTHTKKSPDIYKAYMVIEEYRFFPFKKSETYGIISEFKFYEEGMARKSDIECFD